MDEQTCGCFKNDAHHYSWKQTNRRLQRRDVLYLLEARLCEHNLGVVRARWKNLQETDKKLHGLHDGEGEQQHQTNASESFVFPYAIGHKSRAIKLLLTSNPEDEGGHKCKTKAQESDVGRLPNIYDVRRHHTAKNVGQSIAETH